MAEAGQLPRIAPPEVMPGWAGTPVGCLPDASQTLLLRAALAPDAEAAEAWSQWYARHGLEVPGEASLRLLPLVYRNLERCGGRPGPEWNKVRGMYRRSWAHNQWLYHRAQPVLEEFSRAGWPVMLFKGAALGLLAYPDPGARPMLDVDILVPPGLAADAFAAMEKMGWRARRWRPGRLRRAFFSSTHAMDFESPEGGRIDLHWHPLVQCCHESASRPFWRHASAVRFLELDLKAPAATEHLLAVCVHGIVWSPLSGTRWVADAMLLLRTHPVDWRRLEESARELDLAPHLRAALRYLRSEWQAPVPDAVLAALELMPCRASTMAEYARDVAPFARRTARQDLLAFWGRWRRSLGGASPWLRLPQFAEYLQHVFELERAGLLPAQLLRSAVRRIRSRA